MPIEEPPRAYFADSSGEWDTGRHMRFMVVIREDNFQRQPFAWEAPEPVATQILPAFVEWPRRDLI